MTDSHLIQRRRFLKQLGCGFTGLGLVGANPLFSEARISRSRILLGIDVLERDGFPSLQRRRVGLLTHPAGVNRFGVSTIDVLRRTPKVNLVALFGPEHGIYGDEKANVPVLDRIDPRTRLPVFSLYGQFRRPTAEMLEKIDIMVIDLQDVGARSYTYVSCMRYVIEECFTAGKPVIVLDRPNPLGGIKVDGPPLEEKWMSYVGAFQVPYVHAMTIGELANMCKNKPGVLKVPDSIRRKGNLRVVTMAGWKRNMMWPDTGLNWVPTSPAIPDLSAVLGYPMTGLGAQLGGFTHGYGTHLPFRLLQFPRTQPEDISAAMSRRGIAGLEFPVVRLTENGKPRRATYVKVSDWAILRPTELSLHMMILACQWNKTNPFAEATDSLKGLFNKHVGDERVLNFLIQKGTATPVRSLLESWADYCRKFKAESRAWYLY